MVMASVVIGPTALALHRLGLLPNHGTWISFLVWLKNSKRGVHDSYIFIFIAYYFTKTGMCVIQNSRAANALMRGDWMLILKAVAASAAVNGLVPSCKLISIGRHFKWDIV